MSSVENMRKAVEETVDLNILLHKTLAERDIDVTGMDKTVYSKLLEVSQKLYVSKEINSQREARENSGKEKKEWESDPATDGQKKFMDKLSIEYPDDVSKGEASKLIDKHTDKGGGSSSPAASSGAKKSVIVSDGENTTYDLRKSLGKLDGISYNSQYHNWDGKLSKDDIEKCKDWGLSVRVKE